MTGRVIVSMRNVFANPTVPFPAQNVTIQLLGLEESHFGKEEAGRAEIINLTFAIEANQVNNQLQPGQFIQYAFPFSLEMPDWLPDSMILAEPVGKTMLSVKHRLTAQIEPSFD